MSPVDRPSAAFYETDQALAEYLLFHYGKPDDVLPYKFGPLSSIGFPARCVEECFDYSLCGDPARGLDLGCAVGRSTFELTKHCPEVIGVDFSFRFVEAARRLQRDGRLNFERLAEAETRVPCEAALPDGIDPRRATFLQGDALNLPPDLGVFDLILCANLIDRLPDPPRFLQGITSRLKPGGQLAITSPYTWMEAYTPRQKWLSAQTSSGSSFDGLRHLLSPDFTLLSRRDLPFLIREHNRKYQWSVADATTWKRTG